VGYMVLEKSIYRTEEVRSEGKGSFKSGGKGGGTFMSSTY